MPGSPSTVASGARGRALLGGRRSRPGAAGDDGVPPPGALPPGAVASGARSPDRHAADRAPAGGAGPARRQPAAARLRAGHRRRLPHRRRAGRGAGATGITEPHQSFDHQRLWADLLSSAALSFNLFGDLAADLASADRAVHTWWPDAPGTVCDVRFAHSPGRLDPGYLNSLRAFDVAFLLDLGGGARAVIGVDVNYHERNKVEQPKPRNAARNMEVCDRSGAFAPTARQPPRSLGPGRDVARAPPAALHAPARERQVDVGPLRRHVPGGQRRPRRRRQSATGMSSPTTRPTPR